MAKALSIAGCDPSGFAGYTADLRTFGSLGVHGFSVASAITVQSPQSFSLCSPVDSRLVADQILAVFDCFGPVSCKIGLIPDKDCLRAVSSSLASTSVVLDPILGASAGTGLSFLDPLVLAEGLFSLCQLVTPNIPEAEALLSKPIRSVGEMTDAAAEIHRRYDCAVLIKGGHLEDSSSSTDVLVHGSEVRLFEVAKAPIGSIHGSGCFLSASITGHLALGFDLLTAVEMAKDHISAAFSDPVDVGVFPLLNRAP